MLTRHYAPRHLWVARAGGPGLLGGGFTVASQSDVKQETRLLLPPEAHSSPQEEVPSFKKIPLCPLLSLRRPPPPQTSVSAVASTSLRHQEENVTELMGKTQVLFWLLGSPSRLVLGKN